MSTTMNGFARRGSQRWLQIAVDRAPELLNAPIREALGAAQATEVDWVSPRSAEGFIEYRDEDFLRKVDLTPRKSTLRSFWPARGPVWDGLARMSDGTAVLVEAKAHIAELVSGACAAGATSRPTIERSMREVQRALAPKTALDWTRTFYQYTNRLAHLYFLRELNNLNVHLVHVLFVNAHDVDGPTTRAEWQGALALLRAQLGLNRHRLSPYVHDVYVDVALLPTS